MFLIIYTISFPYIVKASFHSIASVYYLKLLNTEIKHSLQMYK
ncbi:hypothetical protein BACPLE_03507 [Phocaeicola plebeius DSM 17135]|uniref:Uncharacterized protein n=1 Tax=Phocaeicola plebeius (strain DSM 17135 / JCM 12973 / CCUG 54634 / M2) TaxID=484018 RepID=B5D3B3_PHOPM|nr:hypothetical protein BACPLE_03507 [Phocaeicola plebeius DSM 17135]